MASGSWASARRWRSSSRPGSQYLGWKNQALGTVTALGSKIAFTASNTHVIWLDDQLTEIGETDLSTMPGVLLMFVAWVDAHHAVGEVQVDNKFLALLIDTDHLDHPTTIATFPSIDRLEYQSASASCS